MNLENDVTKPVLDYLQRPNVNYGILITGDWGCGKTFYWENTLKNRIKDEFKNKKILYISINGLNSTEEINRKILLECLKIKSNGLFSDEVTAHTENLTSIIKPLLEVGGDNITKYLGLFTSIMEINLNVEGLINMIDFSKFIICIDDVERYQGNLEEFMGFCNDFLEHRGTYIIFIANESKIRESVPKDDEQSIHKNYLKIKEKVIGKTIVFSINQSDIINNIINQVCRDDCSAMGLMKKNIPVINNIINKSGTHNYRVLRILLDDLYFLYDKARVIMSIHKEIVYDKENLENSLLKFTLAAGLELRAKGETHILELQNMEPAIQQEFTKPDKSYLKKFKECYYDTIYVSEREFFPSIINYLEKSSLNEEQFTNEINRFAKIEITPQDYLLNIGYWKLSDDEFEEKIKNKLLDNITNGSIHISIYQRLFLWYIKLIKLKLIPLSIDELKNKFLSGLSKISNIAEQEPKDDINVMIGFTEKEMGELSDEYLAAYEEIKRKVQDVIAILKEKRIKSNNINFIALIQNNFDEAIKNVFPSGENANWNSPLFIESTPEQLYEILKEQHSNEKIIDFRNMLLNRIYYISEEVQRADEQFLKEFANYILEKNPDKQDMKLSETLFIQLANDIKTRLLPINSNDTSGDS